MILSLRIVSRSTGGRSVTYNNYRAKSLVHEDVDGIDIVCVESTNPRPCFSSCEEWQGNEEQIEEDQVESGNREEELISLLHRIHHDGKARFFPGRPSQDSPLSHNLSSSFSAGAQSISGGGMRRSVSANELQGPSSWRRMDWVEDSRVSQHHNNGDDDVRKRTESASHPNLTNSASASPHSSKSGSSPRTRRIFSMTDIGMLTKTRDH